MTDGVEPDRTRWKVGRVAEEYGLEGLGAELERRWTGADGERESLRSLADAVNRRILESVLRRHGRPASPDEVDLLYEALDGDGAARGTRTRKRRELERAGVDVETVLSDFVSHQAVHTYLTEHRSASVEPASVDVSDARERLGRLQSRTAAVTGSTLDRLGTAGEIADRDYEVLVDVRVLCPDCDRTRGLEELLAEGGCPCGDGEDERGS